MIVELLTASLAIMIVSLAGVIFVWKRVGAVIEKQLAFLVSFAAGVFAVLVVNLGVEVAREGGSNMAAFGWIMGGVFLTWILMRALPHGHEHHAHENDHQHDRKHAKLDARRLIFGDSLHNIGDGILLAAAFATSTSLGIAATVSVFIHEFVQEVAEFFVLREAGYSVKKALKTNFIVSGTILVGALGGYFLLDKFSMFELPILGLATGVLVTTLLQDLLPHSISEGRANGCIHKHLIAIVLGVATMTLVATYTGDSHSHSHGGHDTHDHHQHEEDVHQEHEEHDHDEHGHEH